MTVATLRRPGDQAVRWGAAAWLLAGGVAVAWLGWAPTTPDLAAQEFRAQLFAAHGPAIYDAQWYGGHLLPGYGVLFAPLGALLGVRLAGALATAAAIVLFDGIARARYGSRALLGTAWFALAAAVDLLSSRLTFALGLACALGALRLVLAERRYAAPVAGAAATLASPLAGLFLAGAAIVWGVSARRRSALLVAVVALGTLVALEAAFAEGGTFGFPRDQLAVIVLIACAGAALLPAAESTLRWGFLLYGLAAVVIYCFPSPVGSNVTRLGLLFAGPVLACALRGPRLALLAVLAPALLGWLWLPAQHDLVSAGDVSANAAYFRPLDSFLAGRGPAPLRVEIPFTREHWESVYVADRFMLARGWERQLDRRYNPIFYRRSLTSSAYRRWLLEESVDYVALADAPLDDSARAERALILSRPSYLVPVWRARHWTVFAVRGARPLLEGPGRLERVLTDSFAVFARRPGTFDVRLRYSRYWSLPDDAGCVAPTRDGWTALRLTRPGAVTVSTSFALDRVLGTGARCS